MQPAFTAKALNSIIRAYDGCGPETKLTYSILHQLQLSSPDELIGWTYAYPCWAWIATLVPVVVSCAEAADQVANDILLHAVQELASSVKAVVQRLGLCGKDGKDAFPLVMVGNVLEANRRWFSTDRVARFEEVGSSCKWHEAVIYWYRTEHTSIENAKNWVLKIIQYRVLVPSLKCSSLDATMD